MSLNIKISPSEFVEKFIRVDGEPFVNECGFRDWPFLEDIYDETSKYMVLKASRQCSKSTTLGNLILAYSAAVANYKSLYVGPTQTHTTTFSVDRLMNPIENSPLLETLTSRKLTNNVNEKIFINGSIIRLRSAFVSPRKVRGIPSRMVAIDEIQEINIDFFPVILECAATFPTNRKIMFAGTPLTLDNAIEHYWSHLSTMNEWMVKCQACGKWNGTTIKNVGKTGYVCEKCASIMDVRTGQWVTNQKKAIYAGYHINQLMTPYTVKDWDSIRIKYEDYAVHQFHNEVLGESFDQGVKPITLEELYSCCQNYSNSEIPPKQALTQITCAGIDWSGGEHSYTVLTIIIVDRNDKFRVLYSKQYSGIESMPDFVLRDILEKLNLFSVNMICADAGMGITNNYMLQKDYGTHKLLPVYYSASLREIGKWEKKSRQLIVNRTKVMEMIFRLLKSKDVVFPKAEEMKTPFFDDILSVFIEENQRGDLRYDHSAGITDDFMHSLTYSILAMLIIRPRPELFFPKNF